MRHAYLEAMQKGLISQPEVDVNLARIFKARFQLGHVRSARDG